MLLIRCFEGSSVVKFSMLQKLGLGEKMLWEAVSWGVPGGVRGQWCSASVMARAGFF